jgi:NAD+ kinase
LLVMTDLFIPKHPVISAYPKMPEVFSEVEAMSAYLKEKGLDAPHGSIYDEELRRRVRQGDFDLFIIAGGDGSVLRAGHLCAPSRVPILGVNLGSIGFLIQVDRHEWREYFDKLFNGEAWIEIPYDAACRAHPRGRLVGSWDALNEVVVGRGQTLRPVRLSASVDGRLPDELCC